MGKSTANPNEECFLYPWVYANEDSILNQVLQRSGQAGIFTSPKTGEKKHDPRYVVIPIQVTSLEKALQLTVGNEWALGIVKRSERFAIRCLRENGNAMRSKLQPEAAYVQSGTFDSNDHMYVLKMCLYRLVGMNCRKLCRTKDGMRAR